MLCLVHIINMYYCTRVQRAKHFFMRCSKHRKSVRACLFVVSISQSFAHILIWPTREIKRKLCNEFVSFCSYIGSFYIYFFLLQVQAVGHKEIVAFATVANMKCSLATRLTITIKQSSPTATQLFSFFISPIAKNCSFFVIIICDFSIFFLVVGSHPMVFALALPQQCYFPVNQLIVHVLCGSLHIHCKSFVSVFSTLLLLSLTMYTIVDDRY